MSNTIDDLDDLLNELGGNSSSYSTSRTAPSFGAPKPPVQQAQIPKPVVQQAIPQRVSVQPTRLNSVQSDELDNLLDDLGDDNNKNLSPPAQKVSFGQALTQPRDIGITPPPVSNSNSNVVTKSPGNYDICGSCGCEIRDEALRVSNEVWHASCLKCGRCLKNLRGMQFIQGDKGKVYCSQCGMRWLHENGKV